MIAKLYAKQAQQPIPKHDNVLWFIDEFMQDHTIGELCTEAILARAKEKLQDPSISNVVALLIVESISELLLNSNDQAEQEILLLAWRHVKQSNTQSDIIRLHKIAVQMNKPQFTHITY